MVKKKNEDSVPHSASMTFTNEGRTRCMHQKTDIFVPRAFLLLKIQMKSGMTIKSLVMLSIMSISLGTYPTFLSNNKLYLIGSTFVIPIR